jgi:hypothetical protein
MKRVVLLILAFLILVFLVLLSVPVAQAVAQIRMPASGTAWDPAAATHPALHAQKGAWEVALHGHATAYRADEGGVRGEEQWGSTNWLMGSAERALGDGALRFRGMVSLEPVTIGGCGTPNLLQTGEVCDGQAIVDAQHPHELFSELSASYAWRLGRGIAGGVYVAAVGGPALGPAAFPHRASARHNPVSPITHHWLDATHVAFGVATLGIESSSWRVEASAFNGREPDDERFDFDFAPPQSISARIQLAPSDGLVLQVSHGRMRNAHGHVTLLPPELDCPPGPVSGLVPAHRGCHLLDQQDLWLDVDRTTASVSYHHPRSAGREWSVTAAWGHNEEQAHVDTDGALVEGRVDAYGGVAFGRAEYVEKSDHDLGIRPTLVQFLGNQQRVFDLTKLVLGYAREVSDAGGFAASAGIAASWSRVPSDLEKLYGDRWPLGATMFFSLRPGHGIP